MLRLIQIRFPKELASLIIKNTLEDLVMLKFKIMIYLTMSKQIGLGMRRNKITQRLMLQMVLEFTKDHQTKRS